MNVKDNEGKKQGLMPSVEDMANIARIAAKIASKKDAQDEDELADDDEEVEEENTDGMGLRGDDDDGM